MVLFLRLLCSIYLYIGAPSTCNAFTSTITQGIRNPHPFLLAVSSKKSQASLPTVEFIDPQTGCEVVLLGCFHGTTSSSEDVKRVITPGTSVVALELCHVRFADLRRAEEEFETKQPWIIAYLNMISKAAEKQGFPAGLAAAVLSGFSGLQSAISGFVPGLEFRSAMEQSVINECDIVLADQVVDETLRQIGNLPRISCTMNSPKNMTNTLMEWKTHATTLKRAVIGDEDLPRVQLGDFLFRSTAAMQDLFRLTVPPISMFLLMLQIASTSGMGDGKTMVTDPTAFETISHLCASTAIIGSSFVGLTLPAIKVIITDRDGILTSGIQAACRHAGKGGRVVAVLGFLHVNGVAHRMIKNKS
eukprot:scaffold23091_cov152-Cylindrotheca_fusiformis.AAC.2